MSRFRRNLLIIRLLETVQNFLSGEKSIIFTKNTHESMIRKKKEDFDYQNFEQQVSEAI